MASRFEPTHDNPLRPLGSVDDVQEDVTDEPDDGTQSGTGRMDALPEHERDENATIGGGVMAMGGTSVDRGTGTLSGDAQAADTTDFGSGDTRDQRSLGDAADEALGHDE
jgi:hypothetical protein